MSTIGLTYHDEDVHQIIREPMPPTIKSPRYKSKRIFTDNEKKKYNGHQTFGLAHYEAPESKNFLKKRKQPAVIPAVKLLNKKEFKCTINCKTSPIPKPSLDKAKQEKKNYVKENIKKVLALTPKKAVPRRVETPRGTAKDLAHLLEMIKIRESEYYGKLPKYLCEQKMKGEKEKQERERKEQAIKEYREKMGIGAHGMGDNVYMVDKETRQKILDGLKENWNELSKQFLKLPVMTDTWPKIKRKLILEKELIQLEKDIRLVESHPYIYLERMDRSSVEEMVSEEFKEEKSKQQEQTEVKETETEIETEKEKPVDEVPVDEVGEIPEEKKEEDKEINIHNY